jgi:hypothetical protein
VRPFGRFWQQGIFCFAFYHRKVTGDQSVGRKVSVFE